LPHPQLAGITAMKKNLSSIGLALIGMSLMLAIWALVSATVSKDLPSPVKTWQESKVYITSPWEKRGEMDQGILRMASYSLVRVAKGYFLALLIGTPLGFFLGKSRLLARIFDP